MKVGENPLYTMRVSYLELATEVVLEPTSPFKRTFSMLPHRKRDLLTLLSVSRTRKLLSIKSAFFNAYSLSVIWHCAHKSLF